MRRALAAALALLAVGAAPGDGPPALAPGLWRTTNTPGAATLDGRPLKDLPVAPTTSETVCLTPEQATAPLRWLSGDTLPDCAIERQTAAGGRVEIVSRCPPVDPGQPAGTLSLSGEWAPTRYRLAFDTIAPGANGRMAFAGTLAGERIGDCPGATAANGTKPARRP